MCGGGGGGGGEGRAYVIITGINPICLPSCAVDRSRIYANFLSTENSVASIPKTINDFTITGCRQC